MANYRNTENDVNKSGLFNKPGDPPSKIMHTGGDDKIINNTRVKTSWHISQSKIKDEDALITDVATSSNKGKGIGKAKWGRKHRFKSKYKTSKPGGGLFKWRLNRSISGTKR